MKSTDEKVTTRTKRSKKSPSKQKKSTQTLYDFEKINLFSSLFSNHWKSFFDVMSAHSDLKTEDYTLYWQNYISTQQKLMQPFLSNTASENPLHESIQQSYQIMSEQTQTWLDMALQHVDDTKIQRKLRFLTKQLIEALHPNNFLSTNPDALKLLLNERGENLINGFKQFLEDAELSKVIFNITSADSSRYIVGENIAITKGKIIFQNEIMQLIHYEARTEKVYEIPLLIVPPWINKYYILDLQADNSYVKWILDQGYSVFLISWVNPTSEHARFTFTDYMENGPLTAMQIVRDVGLTEKINVLGYCVGGTLLACALSFLAAKEQNFVNSVTFLTTLLDFSDPGDLGVFIDEEQLSLLESYIQRNGFLDGELMNAVFTMLRPQELLWSNYVNRYMKGQKPMPLDFLNWNSDSTNISGNVHLFYLREMYLQNHLAKSGAITLSNIPIDLGKINIPSYFLAAQKDHITIWTSCYKSMQLLSGKKKFVLANSGHVAGVINPPIKNKYGYSTYADLTLDSTDWLQSATLNSGSWWTDWETWLKDFSGDCILVNKEYHSSYQPLEDAPGSYVKTKLSDLR
ncbi:MAG: alpha/beta fold hydrolase [Gammaproteobacteria bacterium]